MIEPVAENLWVKRYPLGLLGAPLGRTVTFIRLHSGELIIHSTAPFTKVDIRQIEELGRPSWIVDAILGHDTFAKEGSTAFANVPYLAPAGFSAHSASGTLPLLPAPSAWAGELEVLRVEGMPDAAEHVFLHIPSKTLIVADMLFNFPRAFGWEKFVHRCLMGVKLSPDSGRLFQWQVKERDLYEHSICRLLEWDFDRIIVGHGDIVPTGGKAKLIKGLASKGLLPRTLPPHR